MLSFSKYLFCGAFLKKRKRFPFVVVLLVFLLTDMWIFAFPQPKDASGLYQQKARQYLRSNRPDSALFYFRKSAAMALQQGDEPAYLTLRLQVAGCFLRMGENDSALRINVEVLRVSREKHLRQVEMISENALGQLLIKESRNREALEHFTAALMLAGQLHDKQAIAFSNLNLGNTFAKLGLYKQAGDAYRKALQQLSQEKDTSRIKTTITRQLVYVLEKEGKKDSARLLLRKLGISSSGQPSSEQLARSALDRAHYFHKTGEQQAVRYYHQAEQQAKKAGIVAIQIDALKNLAEIALLTGRLQESLRLAQQALRLTEQLSGSLPFPDIYKTLYLAWKQKGEPDSALFYHEKMFRAQQTVYGQNQRENLADLRVKYQTDLTQKQLLQLKNETLEKDINLKTRQMQVNTLLGSSFTLILVLALLVAFYFYKQKKNGKIQQQEREKLLLEKEAEAAQALVMGEEKERRRMAQELHDGIGVLLSSAGIFFSNIEEQTEPENRNMVRKVRRLVAQAGTEVRRISHNMMPVVLTRFGLKAALEDLFEDFSEKADMKTHLHISLHERLDENKEFMIFRMVQELLHNTLKHSKADEVTFLFRRHGKIFFVDYRDNGVGFNVEKSGKSGGIGLQGIRSRVEFLHGTFDLQSSPGQGFSVKVTFPAS